MLKEKEVIGFFSKQGIYPNKLCIRYSIGSVTSALEAAATISDILFHFVRNSFIKTADPDIYYLHYNTWKELSDCYFFFVSGFSVNKLKC